MKHFSSLVLLHLVFISRKLRLSWSTEDAIAFALHTALSHLEKQGSYVRMLFVDFNSPFNTIILDILIIKLANLRLPPSTCSWIRDLQTPEGETRPLLLFPSRSQHQLSPGLRTKPTDLLPLHIWLQPRPPREHHSQIADDTTVVGLITGGKLGGLQRWGHETGGMVCIKQP